MSSPEHKGKPDDSPNDPFNLRAKGIKNPDVVDAFNKTPRSDFLPPRLSHMAHFDGPVPIGSGQTISQPSLVAHMTSLLEVNKKHDVLEIGTGSGYQTAILARLANSVTSIEIIEGLHLQAKELLKKSGYLNVNCVLGNGNQRIFNDKKFDRIMVTAAARECPDQLVEQLSSPGKMVIPIGPEHEVQYIYLYSKNEGGVLKIKQDIAVRFVPFVDN